MKLPENFADLFFLHDTSRRQAGAPRSSKEIEGESAKLEEKLSALKTEHGEALAREKARSDADAEEMTHRAALAEAEKKRADADAEALKKKLKDSGKA